ncbi:natriuretic peptides B [Saccopteryx leptura]|uniref:natriuretic peptides B n=1 Tax=Saccopteryx leptura TaxID=249018 RepID=UPI00339C122A
MDLQMGLSWALSLLLFLHLWPLGGHSHPLGGSGPSLELSGVQELLDRLPSSAGELQEEQVTPKLLLPGHSSTDARETRQAASTGGGQALQGLQTLKKMSDSGCFGRRLDRISFSSGLGCKLLKRH